MASRPQQFTKVNLTPKRSHGFAVLLFIMGTLFPPLAVAARFGIGADFFINLILTICGYIPGHVHNFYIQNIRNNKNHQRTPKWVQRYGLVDTSEIKRKERRSQWANRYNDRLPASTLRDQPYAEGQEGASSVDLASEEGEGRPRVNGSGEFWSRNEERYYGANGDSASVESSGRWRYPANFDDAAPPVPPKKSRRKKKDKKDRWARTEDAYSIAEADGTAKKKSKRKSRSATQDADTYSHDSSTDFPEDPEGGLYSESRRQEEPEARGVPLNEDDIFNQEV